MKTFTFLSLFAAVAISAVSVVADDATNDNSAVSTVSVVAEDGTANVTSTILTNAAAGTFWFFFIEQKLAQLSSVAPR